MANHFLIIGNQGNGTAMLRGLLNAHSQLEVPFQAIDRRLGSRVYLQWDLWKEKSRAAEKRGLLWGTNIIYHPITRATRGSISKQIISNTGYFKVLWIFRRLGRLQGKHFRSAEQWERTQQTYWKIKDARPERIIMVSFEDILLRTQSELRRICDFLGVRHERNMIEGLKDTGNPCFDYGKILLEKL